MASGPRASLIVTAYNQEKDLRLLLLTLERQSVQDFEVIVADDGSGPATRELLDALPEGKGARRLHVWHEDTGYRKAAILNKAVRAATAPWLIFVDADCVMHPRFIEDHLEYAAPRALFMGRRVDLGADVSDWLRAHPEKIFSLEFYARVFVSAAQKQTLNANRSLRIAPAWCARAFGYHRVPDILGSNFSICAQLLRDVNGFNEGLEHYWGEDGDLFIRARNAGAQLAGRKAYAVQFHLWHARRAPQAQAEARYVQRLHNDFSTRWVERGLETGPRVG